MKRRYKFALFVAIGLVLSSAFSQPVQILDDAEGALVQRIVQYESVLGSELKPKVAVCVDDALGNMWLLGDDPTLEMRPSLVDKLRRSAETCAVATSSEQGRLAAQLRAMTERQLKLAQRLEQPTVNARNCVSKSTTSSEFRSCLSKALGKPPTDVNWGYWMVIYERKAT